METLEPRLMLSSTWMEWEAGGGAGIMPGPTVISQLPDTATNQNVSSVTLTLSDPLNGAAARMAANYQLLNLGANRVPGGGDDVPVSITPGYTDGSTQVELLVVGSATVDLNQWMERDYANGASGDWQIEGGGASVKQYINGDPTFFVSDFELIDARFRGRIVVEESGGDDDFIGFAFGLSTGGAGTVPDDFYMLTWKQTAQDFTGLAEEGLKLIKVTDGAAANAANLTDQMWNGENSTNLQVLDTQLGAGTGWLDQQTYEFDLLYLSDGTIDITITRLSNGQVIWDTTVVDPSPLGTGKVGFFNYSQSLVRYSGLQQADFLPEGAYQLRLTSGAAALRGTDDAPLDGDGDGSAGGDYVSTFVIDKIAPNVGNVQITPTAITVQYDDLGGMDPAAVTDPANYSLIASGGAAYAATSFSAAAWGASDGMLGIEGFDIEDFEDATLVNRLSVEWLDAAGNVTSPVTTVPNVFHPVTDDPFGDAFDTGVWDGTAELINGANNVTTTYVDQSHWRIVRFHIAGGTSSIGFSFQQSEINQPVYVNGELLGYMSDFGIGTSSGRNGYLRIDSTDGSDSIFSVAIGDNGSDGFTFDHLAIAPAGTGGGDTFNDANAVDVSSRFQSITYNPVTGVATLMLSPGLPDELYQLTIDATVVADLAGNALNGGSNEVRVLTLDAVTPQISLDLQPGSDSGVADDDDITNDATPTFDVTVNEAGVITLDVDGDGQAEAMMVAMVAGTYALTTPMLSDGVYDVEATLTPIVGSPVSAMLPVRIDTRGPRGIGGDAGNGLFFDGVNDAVTVGNDPSLQPTTALTIEGWIRPGSLSFDYPMLLGRWAGSGGVESYYLSTRGARVFAEFNTTGNGNVAYETADIVQVNQWQHIAVSFDSTAGQVKLYLNGQLRNTFSGVSGTITPGGGPTMIGMLNRGGVYAHPFHGMMDEVRLWTVARTQAEIAEAMDRSLTGTEAGLVGYWRFDAGSGTTAADQSPNGNDGVLGAGEVDRRPAWQPSNAPIGGDESMVTAPLFVRTLRFNEAIDATTLTGAVSLFGPGGANLTDAINSIDGLGDTFVVSLDAQVAPGDYRVEVAPTVTDLAGNALNQDDDETNGEAGHDLFIDAFDVAADTTGPAIVDYVPSGSVNTDVASMRVVFSEFIDSETFSAEDVMMMTPSGPIDPADITVTPVGGSGEAISQWASTVIAFSSQYTTGNWSAAQALGTPNTFAYGDIATAWAPVSANGTIEFITVGFDTPVFATGVTIRETWGNGFVRKIEARDEGGAYHTVWEGVDPSLPGTPVDFLAEFLQTPYRVTAVRITTDTNHNLGTWEEIDAIAIHGSEFLSGDLIHTFDISFPTQTAEGAYTLEIGPEITDLSGNSMTVGAEQLVYSTDFDSPVGAEWSNPTRANSQATTQFLGRHTNTPVTLTLASLPAHTQVRVVYDLLILDSWDGNGQTGGGGPDYFGVEATGVLPSPLFEHSFSNFDQSHQSYPGTPDGGRTNLGFNSWPDSVYRDIEHTFDHSDGTLTLTFRGRDLQEVDDESWGIDNVRVYVTLPAGGGENLMANGGFDVPDVGGSFVSYTVAPAGFEWIIGNSNVDLINNLWHGSSGAVNPDGLDQSVDIDNTAFVSQTFATVPGQAYRLSLDYARNPAKSSAIGYVTVQGGATLVSQTLVHNVPASNAAMNWQSYETTFIADGTSTTLRVQGDASNGFLGFALDNVRVEPVSAGGAFTATFTIDKTGPTVAAIAPEGVINSPFSSVDVTFDSIIRGTSVAAGDLTLMTPGGGTLNATGVAFQGNNTFRFTFPQQIAGGVYTVKVGPNVLDLAGNAMNQNGNDINGEPDDAFTGTIELNLADLRPTNLTAPTSAVVGEAINVNWAVLNDASGTAQQTWSDRVYLSTNDQFDGGDIFLGTFGAADFSPLGPGQQYMQNGVVTIPASVDPAVTTWHLIVAADALSQQAESNESNNTRAMAITLRGPDLRVINPVAPSTASRGETINVQFTVRNTPGTATALADWSDAVYLSTDATLGGSDTRLASISAATFTPLAPGGTYLVNATVTIPGGMAPGNYQLLLVADDSLHQGETSNANNVFASPIQIREVDLVVDAVMTEAAAQFGQTIDVTYTVRNLPLGGEATTAWSDRVWLSSNGTLDGGDLLLRTEPVGEDSPLPSGETYARTVSVTLPLSASLNPGPFFLIVETDATQVQGELDNSNNTRAAGMNLTLPPLPDLVVSNITAPISAVSGTQIEVSWTLTNSGAAPAVGTWNDQVLLSNDAVIGGDQHFGHFSFTGQINPGQSIVRTQAISLPLFFSGSYRVVVATDTGNAVFEHGNDANNASIDDQVVSVTQAPLPNLQVQSVTAPGNAFSGQKVVIEWVVRNVGTDPTSSPVWYDGVWLSLQDHFDGTEIFLGQAQNASFLGVTPGVDDSYVNSLEVTLPKGIDDNYYFLVATDRHNQVIEGAFENDNAAAGGPTDVEMTPPPDLQVTAVNAPATAFSGQPMTVSWTVTNEGDGATDVSQWWDRLWLSTDREVDAGDVFLGDLIHNGVLTAEATYTASRTVTLPVGYAAEDVFIIVRSDVFSQVFEFALEDNNDNADQFTILLTPPPDLEVDSVAVVTSPALSSRPVRVDYTVSNHGLTTTPNSSWSDRLYLSVDNVLDPAVDTLLATRAHFGALAAGGSYTESFNPTLADFLFGTYHFIVVTDVSNQVFEVSEANNERASSATAITQSPGNLVVTAAGAPSLAESGKAMLVNWTVTNTSTTSDSAAGSWSDRVVLSIDDVLGNADDRVLGTFGHSGVLPPMGSYDNAQLVAVPIDVTTGNYNVFVTTDYNGQVVETNENDNRGTATTVVLQSLADLQVTAINVPSIELGDLMGGGSITVQYEVTNRGVGTNNATNWRDDVFLSADPVFGNGNDFSLGSVFRGNSLAPGAKYTGMLSGTIPAVLAGDFYIIIRTDLFNQVYESNELNNVAGSDTVPINAAQTPPGEDPPTTVPVTPAPPPLLPDLAVSNVDGPSMGISGQPISVSWIVTNIDEPTGTTVWSDSVYLSRDQVFDASFDIALGSVARPAALNEGQQYMRTSDFTIPRGLSGEFYVFVVADGGHRIDEGGREINNVGFDGTSMLVTLTPPADLMPGMISVPTNAAPGQNATISYTVHNLGDNPAEGQWFDSLYISEDDTWDLTDPLFARVLHVGTVPGMGSYTEMVTAPLPGVLPGDYHVIIRSDIRNLIPESNEGNNLAASLNQTSIDAQPLLLGETQNGTLPTGASAFYRVEVDGGESLRIVLDGASAISANELYVRYGQMPSRTVYDFAFDEPFNPDQDVLISSTRAGTYYILAFAANVPAGQSAAYSIEADLLQFSLLDVGPERGSNLGEVTLTLDGVKFTPGTEAALISPGGSVREPLRSWWVDESTMWATFDLRGLGTGLYDVQISDGGGLLNSQLPDVFEVTNGSVGDVVVNLSLPSALRPGQLGVGRVEYANIGQTDALAPVLNLLVDNARLRLPSEANFGDMSLEFLGINRDGPAGLLPPGASGSTSFIFQPTISDGVVRFEVFALDPASGDVIDWSLARDDFKPVYAQNDAFDVLFGQFVEAAGQSTQAVAQTLSDNATRLSQLGVYTGDLDTLLNFEVQQADNIHPLGDLERVVDLSTAAPGIKNVDIQRIYSQSLLERNTLGPLGYGWTHNWEATATTDADGQVAIRLNGQVRLFDPAPGGGFVGKPGERGMLNAEGGGYRLTEVNGVEYVFSPDGLLAYVDDTVGNRITLEYTGLLVSRVVHSNGQDLDFTYLPNGRLESVTDPAGRTVTYSYDAAGRLLTGVDSPAGVTSYSYDNAMTGPTRQSLTAIEYPGGNHRFFEYDARGRLAAQWRDGDAERFTYGYDEQGGVTQTDGEGATTTLLYNEGGQIAHIHNAVGQGTRLLYDSSHNPVLLAAPGNTLFTYSYDASSNLMGRLGPVGDATHFTYEPLLNRLQTAEDPRGHVTDYQINAAGDPDAITFEDGTVVDFAYDVDGNVSAVVNRRGVTIQYTYDPAGRLTRTDYDGGAFDTYSYDVNGHLDEVTDATGVTDYDFDAAGRLVKVTTPDGRFVEFTYDAGGRRESFTDQTGFVLRYEYDPAGRLAELRDGGDNLIVAYTYDAAGAISREDKGNGTFTRYEYDAAGRLTAVFNHAPGGAVNSSFEYTYDVRGQRTSMTTPDGTWTYAYDAAGQLIRAQSPDGDVTEYNYDANGNRTSVVVNGAVTAYGVNGNNDTYTSVGGAAHTWDDDGNLLSDGMNTYSYDDLNRLLSVTTPAGTKTYTYDALGNRVASVEGAVSRRLQLDPTGLVNLVAEYDGAGNLTARYVHSPYGVVSRIDGSGTAFYYDIDGVGSVAGLSGPAGNVVNSYEYDPFGQIIAQTEFFDNPFQFNGSLGVTAEPGDLTAMRNRFHDASLGRFTAIDPLGRPAVNAYTFANNNPVLLVDPLGLDFADWVGAWRRRHEAIGNGDIDGAIDAQRDLANETNGAISDLGDQMNYTNPRKIVGPIRFINRVLCASGLGGVGCDPEDNRTPNDDGSTSVVRPRDPNDILGPEGFGEERFVAASQTLGYTIRFENVATATAPAQRVVVTHDLDADLDFRTFRFGSFGFSGELIDVPANTAFLNQRIDMTAELGFLVDVVATIDAQQGRAIWTLTTIDPATGEQPEDPLIGFLPPNDDMGAGEGFVTYTIRAKSASETGTVIDAAATIVFDNEPPLDTPPIFNTLDAEPPVSAVEPLGPAQSDGLSFTVRWSGEDDEGGSAIRDYTIYVSVDDGPFEVWLADTTLTEADYVVESGTSFRFMSAARDNAGNVELLPIVPDTETTLVTTAGDFNGDGAIDAADVTLLQQAAVGGGEPVFDLNDDGVVDDGDVEFFVLRFFGSQFGDTDLDRDVDVTDLATVATFFGSAGGWGEGDFNGDGMVGLADLSLLATFFGYQPVVGDVNRDGGIDADDIDRLTHGIRIQSNFPILDLNADGVLDAADADYLVRDVLDTREGDTDLDGDVDITDLAAVATSFGNSGGWTEGDVNGDGAVNINDLARLAGNFGFDRAGGAGGGGTADLLDEAGNAPSRRSVVFSAASSAARPAAQPTWSHIRSIVGDEQVDLLAP